MMILTSGWVGIHPHLSLATRAHICLDSITLLLRVPGHSSPLPLQPEQRKKSSVPHCWACLFAASSPPPWWRGQQLQSLGLESDIHRMNHLGICLMSEDWGDWSREGSPSYLSWDAYTVSSGSPVCLWMAPDGLFGTGPAAWQGLWPHLLGVSTAKCPVSSTLSLPCSQMALVLFFDCLPKNILQPPSSKPWKRSALFLLSFLSKFWFLGPWEHFPPTSIKGAPLHCRFLSLLLH